MPTRATEHEAKLGTSAAVNYGSFSSYAICYDQFP